MINRNRWFWLVITLVGIAGAFAGSYARAWAQPAPLKPLAVDMRALLTNPGQYKHQAITFVCRFTKEGNLFRQGGARFSSANHVNFMVWPVEAQLWEKSVRRQILSSLYVNRENTAVLDVLRGLSRYDTLQIVGMVEEVYANLPWIAVEKISVIPGEHLDDAMLQQIAQGKDYMKSGNREKAQLCFEMATGQGAPAFVRQFIQNLTADYAPQRTIEEKPVENFMPIVEAAREAARNKEMREAEKLYRRAQNKCADNAWLYKEIGLFYEYEYSIDHNNAQLEMALDAYRKAEFLNGAADADISFLQARVTFQRDRQKREFAAAEALVNKCLKINREHAMARRLSAEITAEKIVDTPETPVQTLAAVPMPEKSAETAVIDNRPVRTAAAEPRLPVAAVKVKTVAAAPAKATTPAAKAAVPGLSLADMGMEKLGADMDALSFEVSNIQKSVNKPNANRARGLALANPPAAPKPVLAAPVTPKKPAVKTPASCPSPAPALKNVRMEDLPDWAL